MGRRKTQRNTADDHGEKNKGRSCKAGQDTKQKLATHILHHWNGLALFTVFLHRWIVKEKRKARESQPEGMKVQKTWPKCFWHSLKQFLLCSEGAVMQSSYFIFKVSSVSGYYCTQGRKDSSTVIVAAVSSDLELSCVVIMVPSTILTVRLFNSTQANAQLVIFLPNGLLKNN